MTRHTNRRTGRTVVAVLAASSLALAACGGDDDDDADAGTEEAAGETTEEMSEESSEEMSEESSEEMSEESSEEMSEEGTVEETAGGAVEGVGDFRIAIVAPSASNDLAFTQSMVDSVDVLVEELGVPQPAITDGTFVVEDAATAIRGYAEEGYDLVIAHGSQYGGPLQEIAPDFPDVSFAWGTSVDTFGLPNVFAYTTAADEGGYVNGTIAAQITESGVIGVVGPIEVGDAKLYVDGFTNGAEATGDVTVNVNYIDSFSDVGLAAEAATAHVSNGADVLTGTAQMVVGATGVATSEGIPWFGTQSNQTALGEDIVVASQVYHWEVALQPMIESILGGTLGGEVFTTTLENGGLVMEFNDAFGLDPAIQSSAEEVIAGLIAGDISTGADE